MTGNRYDSVRSKKPKAQTKRECLKCSRPFDSTGVANRLCPACNAANQYAPKLGGGVPVAQQEEQVYRW